MSVTIPAVPQVGNCGFVTAVEVVVTGNISLSCQPVQLNWLEVRVFGWRPEYLITIIIERLLHLAVKDFGIVVLQTNDGGNIEFFGL